MKVVQIDLKDIEQNENSRVVYKASDLTELMHSMKKDGQLQPVGVRKLPNGKYDEVFGNRRILAAKKLGWADISAHIVDAETETDRDILNLIENLKRQNTSVSEDGRIFQALRDRNLSVDEIAVRVGLARNRVELALEVFNEVPAEFKRKIVNKLSPAHLKKGEISATAAQHILGLRRAHKLNRTQTRQLMNFAAKDETSVGQISHVAPLLKEGFTISEAIRAAEKLTRITLYVFIDEKRIERLEKKHGKSITQILWSQLEKNEELGVKRLSQKGMERQERDRSKRSA